jgi:hypothetical protein
MLDGECSISSVFPLSLQIFSLFLLIMFSSIRGQENYLGWIMWLFFLIVIGLFLCSISEVHHWKENENFSTSLLGYIFLNDNLHNVLWTWLLIFCYAAVLCLSQLPESLIGTFYLPVSPAGQGSTAAKIWWLGCQRSCFSWGIYCDF